MKKAENAFKLIEDANNFGIKEIEELDTIEKDLQKAIDIITQSEQSNGENSDQIKTEELRKIADLQKKKDILLEKSIFSKKIEMIKVSPNKLTTRLQNPSDPTLLPFPFVFSPTRIDCFKKLLPLPIESITVIEGFSQAGKSNFACHLSLIYRMKPQNAAVIYIGEISSFNSKPHM